jgi:hypothetical protein
MDEPKVIYEFDKNSRELVRLTRKTWNAQDLIDLRVYYKTESGEMKPTQKGLCLRVEYLSELKNAVEAMVRNFN